MDLYKELLSNYLSKEEAVVTFPNLHVNGKEIVEMECYRLLNAIKKILEHDAFDDETCFRRIEELVSLFEASGLGCGNRHDFG